MEYFIAELLIYFDLSRGKCSLVYISSFPLISMKRCINADLYWSVEQMGYRTIGNSQNFVLEKQCGPNI